MRKARVFISCGQRTEREKKIGKSVEDYFSKREFKTYFAERVHSSDALTENIFRALRNSEYFVFIDFQRDRLSDGQYRGSLFVNQEIAIATFLGMDGIGFCEKLIKLEGIQKYHIYNVVSFEDGTEIIKNLEEMTKSWDPASVNELEIPASASVTKNVELTNHPQRPLSDWYHLLIRNNNKQRHAFSVHGYVAQIVKLLNREELKIPTNELHWSGIGKIAANILGGTSRDLDAFYIIHEENKIRFHQLPLGTNNPNYCLPDLLPGIYMLQYVVISSNFKTASKWFRLEFEGAPDSVVFTEQPNYETQRPT